MIPDCRGNLVSIGTKVKVLNIDPNIISGLPEDEISDVNSMVGEVFEIIEIVDGVAFIEKYWDLGDGYTNYHEVGLRSKDFEAIAL